MPSPAPIKLGSAAGTSLVFETGSSISTSKSGIQESRVRALCPDAQNVFNYIPAAGTAFGTVFGNTYLPSTFLVDLSEDGGADIEYLEGNVARVTLKFKRPDPNNSGRTHAKIYVDSVINYKSILSQLYQAPILVQASGDLSSGIIGFPEPVVTVKYTDTTQPAIGGGSIANLYALPGSANAQGFPTLTNISVPYSAVVAAGAVVTYFNGTTYVSATLAVQTTFNFTINFHPNVLGWQLQRLKADPVSGGSFYDIELEWRTFYFLVGLTFINAVPPP